MPAHISKEYRIYLALWRKAFLGPEPVIIKTKNYSLAMSMRQGMYRAIKPFREGAGDEQLAKAAEKYVVYLVKGEDTLAPHFLEFRERKTLQALEASWDELGLEPDDLLIGEEREIAENLQKMLDKTGAKRSTKYFDRG